MTATLKCIDSRHVEVSPLELVKNVTKLVRLKEKRNLSLAPARNAYIITERGVGNV